MTIKDDDEVAVVAAFLRRILDDRTSGIHPGLDHYQQMFPGREDLIRKAWCDLEATDTEDESESAVAYGTCVPERRLGPYRLIEILGGGGQGEVYLAEDTRLNRRVAVKVLHALDATSEEMRSRFRREAHVASRLDHPGICALYDSGVDGAFPYLVMRYVPGDPLSRIISRRREGTRDANMTKPDRRDDGRTTAGSWEGLDHLVRVLEDAARALHAAHEAGVLHRDLKPANIMVTPRGEPVILDFGLARLIEGESSYHTRTGDVFGTPSYMAPELLGTPPAAADRRTDVYALGVTLYEILTRRRPFEAPTRDGLYQAILRGQPPDPRSLDRAVSRELAVVALTAIERDPDHRYQTAEDLAEDLRRVRERVPIRARPPSRLARFERWVRREPAKASILCLLLVVAALGGFLGAKWPDLSAQAALRQREEAERELEMGFLLLGEGDELAIEAFSRAEALAPASIEAVTGRVMALLSLNRAKEALAYLEVEERAAPRDPTLVLMRAEVLRELDRAPEADALEAELGVPTDPIASFVRARREMHRGYRGDALAFRRAVDLMLRCVLTSPEPRALYQFVLAEAASLAQDRTLSLQVADAILSRWGESGTAMAFAAVALAVADPKRAAQTLEQAVALRPGDAVMLTRLGDARRAAGDHPGALSSYRKALLLRPRHLEAQVGLAMALEEAGDRESAADAYEVALSLDDTDPVVPFNLGCLRLRARDFDRARTAFERALRLNPGHAGARCNLGMVLQELGDFDLALSEMKEAVRLRPDRSDYLLNLSSIHVSRGEAREGLRLLGRVLQREPRMFEAHRLRGRALQQMGEISEAIEAFREAVTIHGRSFPAFCDLGEALLEGGAFVEAVTAYRQALDLSGDDPDLHRTLQARIGLCERFAALADELPPLEADDRWYENVSNPVHLAVVAAIRERPAAAAALWATAFDRDPSLARNVAERCRFRAACAAARAAGGQGIDGFALSPQARDLLRARALGWLEEELLVWSRHAGSEPRRDARIRTALGRFRTDPALIAVREPSLLARLPAPDQTRWNALWSGVDAVLASLQD